MSYILDALRRADAEREQGEVPSLHTQQYGNMPGDEDGSDRSLLLIGVIVFLVLALAGALAWHFWGGESPARSMVQGNVSAATPTTTAATTPSPSPAASTATAPIFPPPSMAAAMTPPPPLASLPPMPIEDSASTAQAPALPATKRRAHAAALPASAAEPRRGARAAAASAALPASAADLGLLPDALRSELPALAFGGASYSKDAASRMVILNGRVFHEGDVIAPQLVLKQIKLKTAVLNYKGYRYELGY